MNTPFVFDYSKRLTLILLTLVWLQKYYIYPYTEKKILISKVSWDLSMVVVDVVSCTSSNIPSVCLTSEIQHS